MLDQLEIAIRKYQQLAPNPGRDMTSSQGEQLADWLEGPVSRITEVLLTRPGFRRRVRWPIERLTGETDCEERRLVEDVDALLVRYAVALKDFARSDGILSSLLRLGRYGEEVSEGDPSAIDPSSADAVPSSSPLGLPNIELIASRPWRDLVSAYDYFYATAQLNLANADGPPWGMFLPFMNRDLLVPGDFVSRCMEIRIKHWRDILHRFYIRCDTARQNADAFSEALWANIQNVRSDLNVRISELHSVVHSEQDARIRDSSIALLQTYVSFHPDADLCLLGDTAQMASGVADIPDRVGVRREWEVPERIAAALVDLADLVRKQPPEELIEEMKATTRLVLIEEQRVGFLDGVPIESKVLPPEWHGRDDLMWELLLTLADRASIGRSVDCHSLSNRKAQTAQEPPSSQAVKDRRSGLKKLIIAELDSLIVSAGKGTYRLKLQPSDICLLGWNEVEQLEVLTPVAPRHSHS